MSRRFPARRCFVGLARNSLSRSRNSMPENWRESGLMVTRHVACVSAFGVGLRIVKKDCEEV
jgi:hypothetical protein